MSALLERDQQLEALAAATRDAASGSGVVMLVQGEPGIGKTSLVRAYLSRLPRDTRTFTGGCDDLTTPRALGPLRDAVRWRGGPLAAALESGANRDAVFDAVIEELSHPRDVTVLVVEDVHWADDATLDVLHFVIRRIENLRALVVLTYRDNEIHEDHPLQPLLAAAAGRGLRRIQVPALSESAVATLSADSGRDLGVLYAVTGGNAFFVTETLAATGPDVPATVVDAVLARIRSLDPSTQHALEQLSVVPSHVEHRLVDHVVGGLEVLAEAERSGVLVVDRESVSFRHELARRALEQSLPTVRRVALNRAMLAALLSGAEPDVARILHHAVEAGDVEAILRYAPTAGLEAARAGSHRQALAHFTEALRYEDRMSDAERAQLLEEYAWELHNAHRFPEAVAAAERACQLSCNADDAARCGTAKITLSRLHWVSGDNARAWEAIEEATATLDRTDDPVGKAMAHSYRAAVLALVDKVDEALEEIRYARSLAEAAGIDVLVNMCMNYEAVTLLSSGDWDTSVDIMRECLEHARATHAKRPERDVRIDSGEHLARVYCNLAACLQITERFDELADLIPEALAFVRDRGFTVHGYNLEFRQATVFVHRGQWDEAEETLRQLDRAVSAPGVFGKYMLPALGRLLARRGADDAEAVIRRACAVADASGLAVGIGQSTLPYLEWAWFNGHPETAAQRAHEAIAALDHHKDRRLLGELLLYAKRAGLMDAQPFDGCPEPWASALAGDWFAAAVGFQRTGDDYERAMELAESQDIVVTTQALQVLDNLGAKAAAALVRQRLRDLGVRRIPRGPQEATRTNPAGLTDRQVDVLGLLRDGLTNAEIADRLVLSVRTVDHHVAAILAKLGVASRRQAAERAADLIESAR
jgi:ATP/maltotriose-dependent transcriptional regulator MalT